MKLPPQPKHHIGGPKTIAKIRKSRMAPNISQRASKPLRKYVKWLQGRNNIRPQNQCGNTKNATWCQTSHKSLQNHCGMLKKSSAPTPHTGGSKACLYVCLNVCLLRNMNDWYESLNDTRDTIKFTSLVQATFSHAPEILRFHTITMRSCVNQIKLTNHVQLSSVVPAQQNLHDFIHSSCVATYKSILQLFPCSRNCTVSYIRHALMRQTTQQSQNMFSCSHAARLAQLYTFDMRCCCV